MCHPYIHNRNTTSTQLFRVFYKFPAAKYANYYLWPPKAIDICQGKQLRQHAVASDVATFIAVKQPLYAGCYSKLLLSVAATSRLWLLTTWTNHLQSFTHILAPIKTCTTIKNSTLPSLFQKHQPKASGELHCAEPALGHCCSPAAASSGGSCSPP